MRAQALSTVLIAGFLVACRGETAVDVPAAKVVVYGRVSTANGAAAPRAMMSVAAHTEGLCANPLVMAINAFTNASGDYRAALYSSSRFFAPTTAASQARPTVCVSVRATPSVESGFLAGSAQLTPVVMRSDTVDSVRVDLKLEPSP